MGDVSESQSKLLLWLQNLKSMVFSISPFHAYTFTLILWNTNNGLKNKLKSVHYAFFIAVISNPVLAEHESSYKSVGNYN